MYLIKVCKQHFKNQTMGDNAVVKKTKMSLFLADFILQLSVFLLVFDKQMFCL